MTPWIFATASTNHIVGDESVAYDKTPVDIPVQLLLRTVRATYRGKVDVLLEDNTVLTLHNALVIPGYHENLFSPHQTELEFLITREGCEGYAKYIDGRLTCTFKTISKNHQSYAAEQAEIQRLRQLEIDRKAKTWHLRFCHADRRSISRLSAKLSLTPSVSDALPTYCCDLCNNSPPHTDITFEEEPQTGSVLHAAVYGPMVCQTYNGKRYFMTMTDAESRYVKCVLLSRKSEATEQLCLFIDYIEDCTPFRVEVVKTNGASEFSSGRLNDFLDSREIDHDYDDIRVALGVNNYLFRQARAMLLHPTLNVGTWGDAILTAAYIYNRLRCFGRKSTPWGTFMQEAVDYTNLKAFGCRVSFEEESYEGTLVGYTDFGEYRIFVPSKGIVEEWPEEELNFHENSTLVPRLEPLFS